MTARQLLSYSIFLLQTIILSACTPVMEVTMQASGSLNKSNNCSLPVSVRVYQIKDKTKFLNYSMYDLIHDKTIVYRQAVINPGQSVTLLLHHQQHKRFVALVAILQRQQQGHWRIIIPWNKSLWWTRRLHLYLINNAIKLNRK